MNGGLLGTILTSVLELILMAFIISRSNRVPFNYVFFFLSLLYLILFSVSLSFVVEQDKKKVLLGFFSLILILSLFGLVSFGKLIYVFGIFISIVGIPITHIS